MWLFFAFVAVPIIEVALFIQLGGAIGVWATLGIVILTAALGTMLVREQGRQALMNLRSSFSDLNDPSEPLAHGAMILFAGALLLTPGFFTDAVGFALLVPRFRTAAFNYIRKRIQVQSFSMGASGGASRSAPEDVIETEYHAVDDDDDLPPQSKSPTHRQSGWTKH
jgi:UPF0716 protein FxsA